MPKREIFRKVKENKHLRGGVLLYAAQENVKFDAEIAEKCRFGMKTRLGPQTIYVDRARILE